MKQKQDHHCPVHDMSRREFLCAGLAAGTGLLLPHHVHADGGIHELKGTVFVNREPASPSTSIRPGDLVTVADGGKISFMLGSDVYLLRGGSSLKIGKEENLLVKTLRLLTGGLLAVFGKGEKEITTRAATIGIRGTGIYLDTAPDKTYFCTCYGETELRVDKKQWIMTAEHHHSAWIYTPVDGQRKVEDMGMFMGNFEYHTDDHLRAAEALAGRKVPFDT